MARTRLSLNYKQPYLEVQITPQHADMWGGDEVNVFSLREAWAQTDYKGLFAKLGRQALCYDDERIIGLDDWSLTGAYHDCLKIGYEGHGHKVHALGAYNQTYKNALGGTIYKGGVQDYKNMQAVWYHYDFKRWFSASLLFTNTGMQSADTIRDSTFYQQLLGTYVKFHYPGKQDWCIDLDASFYYQMGRSERGLPINAWMFATEGKAQINRFVQARAGYFILSGDEIWRHSTAATRPDCRTHTSAARSSGKTSATSTSPTMRSPLRWTSSQRPAGSSDTNWSLRPNTVHSNG